ncbi:acetoin utilization protein AcuC [Auritidibacter ignavus]|uniref:acetoin utilization protein AcuC n=1 Tax=Auritidibacter ignavus TaxID=678932 RepID=UPI000F033C1C|nr:acetoin utilization protein AcuC [Auritidibacter ignavus]NIH71330.1 acetoin utilization protein AcuC [Auritidibacter ignavus]RMX23496.1 acetoin utilization protein AcuC [Auritidibacter ignavus]WGH85250.1 acetoin utilization protein AcuC [Auritidibacter ignavus]WGH87537.1 acetoin utilization protein AcuC [Auritidibacter ignavus]
MTDTDKTPVPTAVMWDEELLKYRFSDTHPMAPIRLELTYHLAEQLGVLDNDQLSIMYPPVATDAELARVHTADYIAAVKHASDYDDAAQLETDPSRHQDKERFDRAGLGTEDCPIFADMHTSSARIAGGSLRAAQAIASGEVSRAVNFAGGLHHAHRAQASGFCIYNDAGLAIAHLLDSGVERVAYVDLDAHHGDGVEALFWDDPRVLTISIHESGLMLFPGTGFARDFGGDDAQGSAVNVPISAGAGDAAFLRAVHAVVPQVLKAFSPEVLITQHGCDGHRLDPLADLNLSVDGQRQMMLDAAMWAEDFADNRWLALGGGGYTPYQVVPRIWAHLIAIVAGNPIPLRTGIPRQWREKVAEVSGLELEKIPELMTDNVDVWWRSWEVGYDPADHNDQSVMATRKEIFPLHGLDPWFD